MRYCIDRFEDKYAVCEDDLGAMIDIPVCELPANAREGDVFFKNGNGVYEIDKDETQRRRAEVLRLMGRL